MVAEGYVENLCSESSVLPNFRSCNPESDRSVTKVDTQRPAPHSLLFSAISNPNGFRKKPSLVSI